MESYLLLNVLLSIAYIRFRSNQSRDEAVFRFIVTLMLPYMGLLFFLCIGLRDKLKSNRVFSLLDGYEEDETDSCLFLPGSMDMEKERNLVPIEEALVLNDNYIKRTLIIDIVKEDAASYVGILRKALEDEDTETSHYAATAIAEIKQQFNSVIQELSRKYQENSSDVDVLISYVHILKKYLDSGLMDYSSFEKVQITYAQVLENLLAVYPLEEKYFIRKINCELDRGNTEAAAQYCKKLKDYFGDSENVYFMYLKLFYSAGNYKNLTRILHELRNSPVSISNRLLNTVRFWSLGDPHEG